MDKLLDILLCGGVLILEIAGAIIGILLIQLICYQVFGINLYKSFERFLDKMDKKLTEMFG